MKQLSAFVVLALLGSWLVSGCRIFTDVAPKGIYSPIELQQTQATYTQDPFKYIGIFGDTLKGSIDNSTVRLVVKDAALKYGAVVFYDSLTAYDLIRTGRLTGSPEFYSESKGSQGLSRTIKVRIDQLKGQFQYIVPVGYSSDSTRIYYGQGFIRTKISPWTHVTNLDYYSTQQYKIKFFQANGKLAYILYDQQQIACYEFDPIVTRWINKANFPTNICRNGCTLQGETITGNFVTYVEMVYFTGNQYHLVINTFAPASTFKYRNGEIITDQNFTYTSYKENAYSTQTVGYYAADLQKDTLRFIYEQPHITTHPSPLGPTINYTIPSGYYKPLSGNATYYSIPESIIGPTISAFIGQKLLLNSKDKQNLFTVFDVTKGQFKNVGTVSFADQNKVWTQLPSSDRYVSLIEGDHAYLLNNNLNIFRVTIDAANKPDFSNFYSKWFPGNSATSMTQGVLYQGKLIFLVNDYQLWAFDPTQINIDFTRPGAVTVVPL